MQAFVSLWSADLLDLRERCDLVDDLVDGFHIDVFDGHNVDELLFGPDLVAALRRRTDRIIDVHLNVTDPDHWIDRFAEVGADVDHRAVRAVSRCRSHPRPDQGSRLSGRARPGGARADLGGRAPAWSNWTGCCCSAPRSASKAGSYIRTRLPESRTDRAREPPPDRSGGRSSSTAESASTPCRCWPQAGADGVIPGSLVFGEPDPRAAVRAIRSLVPGQRTSSGRRSGQGCRREGRPGASSPSPRDHRCARSDPAGSSGRHPGRQLRHLRNRPARAGRRLRRGALSGGARTRVQRHGGGRRREPCATCRSGSGWRSIRWTTATRAPTAEPAGPTCACVAAAWAPLRPARWPSSSR